MDSKISQSSSHYMAVTSNKGDQELLYAAPMQSTSVAIPEYPVSLTVGGSPIPWGDKSINQFKDVFIKIQLGRTASAYFVGLFVSCCCISHEEHLAEVKVQFALSLCSLGYSNGGIFASLSSCRLSVILSSL